MEIEYFKNKFSEYGYQITEAGKENEPIIFSNANLEFKLIRQRSDGWELYFRRQNSSTSMKIDFTLEIFSCHNRKMEDIKKMFKGEMSQSDYLSYLYFLIFKEGLFLIKNETLKIGEFINWYKDRSEEYYRQLITN